MAKNPFSLFARATREHLVRPGGGLSGELYDLRSDIQTAFEALETDGGYLRTVEFTDPVAADPNAILLSFATSDAVQAFDAEDLDGVVGDGEMDPPRNITITSTADAHVTAVNVVITGLIRDASGALVAQTNTIATTNGGGVTDAGTKPFSQVTSISIPAMGGANGALEIGFGAGLGLPTKVKARAGLTAALRQVVAGAVVTTGAITNPSGSPVAMYVPATVPDASNDYALTYEVDPT
jgi:hypothetical protein